MVQQYVGKPTDKEELYNKAINYYNWLDKDKELQFNLELKSVGISAQHIYFCDLLGIFTCEFFVIVLQFIVLGSILHFGLKIQIILYLVSFTVYLFCMSGIFLLLIRIFKSYIAFQSFMPVFILLTSILSGCLLNIEIVTERLLIISKIVPTYWLMDAVDKIQLTNTRTSNILFNALVLIAVGTGCIAGEGLIQKYLI